MSPRRPIEEVVRRANRSEISRRTGIHLSHVSRVLSGKRTASSENLHLIAKCLGVAMDDLYGYLTTLQSTNPNAA